MRIRNTVGVHAVFEESLVWSKILQHRKPVRGDLLLCDDGKLQLKHESVAKQV